MPGAAFLFQCLDDGLDELAARSFQGILPRILVSVATAALVTTMLPWSTCLVWLFALCLSELLSVFLTRRQALGHKAGKALRFAHLCNLSAGSLIWTGLGALLWASGTTQGVAGALMVWLSVLFFAQNNAYQSTTGFLVVGGIPSLAMLIFMITGPNPLHLPLLPIVGLFVLVLGFIGDGVARSLSARRRFDETQRKLAESEAQYRVLADNITDVLWLNRASGARLYVSPSIQRALGYTVEEVFGDNFGMVHPDDAERVQADVVDLARRRADATIRCRMQHKDGHYVWMETSIAVARNQTATEEPMLVAVSRNIDARMAHASARRTRRRQSRTSSPI